MKEANFLKRLSAITLAAAITAANVGFDFLPTAKKAAVDQKEEKTVTEVKTQKVMTQKSKYPTSLSFIVEQNENGESVLRASSPKVFNRYFTAELVSLDPPAEGEEPEQLEFSADGTVICKGGNYTVNVRAKVDEETGELLYNPYTIVSGSISIAKEAAVPEAETVPQEIAVIEESEPVEEAAAAEIWQETVSEEETAEEEIPADQTEIAEIPVITETSVVICESDINAAFGLFDMSQSQKLDYTVVKSQDSYNVMIPDDYDQLFFNGIDEEGNAFFNAAGEEVQVNFNEVEMNIQVVNFAELKIKDIVEPEEYSIDRFCGEEALPYYYGEIMKVTPADGYNIVIGDMKYSDAVSVAINDDAVVPELIEVKIIETIVSDVTTEKDNFEIIKNEDNTVTVQLKENRLNGVKYTLSVARKGQEPLTRYSESLTFNISEAEENDDSTIHVEAKVGNGVKYKGLPKTVREDGSGWASAVSQNPLVNEPEDSYWWDNRDNSDTKGYSTFNLSIPETVRISKCAIKTRPEDTKSEEKTLAEYEVVYDANGKITAINLNTNTISAIKCGDAFKRSEEAKTWYFPINANVLHEDIYLDVDYDFQINFTFNAYESGNENNNQNEIIVATLNGKAFDQTSLKGKDEEDQNNYVNFAIQEAYAETWEITTVSLINAAGNPELLIKDEKMGGYNIKTTQSIKSSKKIKNFIIELKRKNINVTVNSNSDNSGSWNIVDSTNINKFGESVKVNANEKYTLNVCPNQGYYVKSISKGEEKIYPSDENTDISISFNANKKGEVAITDLSIENVTYDVKFAKCEAADSEIIKAVVTSANTVYEDGSYSFSIRDGGKYKVSFKNDNTNLSFWKQDKNNTYGAFIDQSESETFGKNVYYVAYNGVIYQVELNVNSISTKPEIVEFKLEKPESALDKVINYLSFGIFSKKDSLTLTVVAKDDSNDGFELSNIKLWVNNVPYGTDDEHPDGNEPKFNSTSNSKTYILPQIEGEVAAYNIKAVAYSKHGENEEVPGNVFVIDYLNNKIDRQTTDINQAENGTPVIIESFSPTLTLTPSVTGQWSNNEGVKIKANAVEAKDSVGNIMLMQSGIDYIQYAIGDKDVEIDSVNSPKLECQIQEGTNGPIYEYSWEDDIVVKINDGEVATRKIVANVYDHAGNCGTAETFVNIDAQKPVIGDVTAYTEDGKPYNGGWTNKPVTIKFTVTDGNDDECSGVKNVTVDNGELRSLGNGKYTVTIDPNAYEEARGFNGDIVITAEDNVGNTAESKPINVKTEKIDPEISGLSIFDDKGNPLENEYVKQLSQSGYIDFYDTTVHVTVNAKDGGNEELQSGVSQIVLGFIPAPGEQYAYDDLSKPYENGGVTFDIVNEFKGSLRFKIIDNVGNVSEWYSLEMLIAESPAAHETHAHAEIILPQTSYANNGIPLYAEVPNVTFYVEDTASGIGSITYSIKYKGDTKDEPYSVDALENKFEKFNVVHSGNGKIDLSGYKENGANNIIIELKAYDKAGNEIIAETKTISIDPNPPEIISVKFNPEGSANQEFFNKQRTATVRAKDSNFNTANLNDLIEVAVTNALGTSAAPYKITKTWEEVKATDGDNIKGDEKVYECVITFVQDAEYTFSISVEDLTKKSAKSEAYKFAIDTTAPKLSISFDNNSKANDKYYNAGRKATLTINEHNFEKNKDSVKSVLSAKDADGITVMDSKEIYDGKLTWTQSSVNKDEWTAQINFNKEGTFNFSMAYTDPAGNNGNDASSGEFVIDTTAPKIEQTFTKSGNKLATNGDLVPHVIFSDYNFLSENQIGSNCKVTIRKFGENGLSSESFSATSHTYTSKKEKSPITFEQIFDIFDKEVEVDGIYEISIRAEDLAGNVTEKNDLTVSINRFGSTYMIVNEEARKAVEMYAANGTPIKDNIGFEIAEVNVTPSKGKRIVRVNVDGTSINELKDGFKTSESRVSLEDDSWESNENGWYQTVYKIDKKNFENDGVYTITLASEDEAGNPNYSDEAIAPRTNLETTFAVDKTDPTVIIAGADKYEYKESEIELTITCMDRNLYDIDELNFDPNNEEKSSFYIKINDVPHNISSLKSQLGADISNDESGNIVIKLPVKGSGKNSKQNVDVLLMDKAGNSSIESVDFVLSVTNNWLMIIVIAASVLILGTAVFFITKKVRNR